MPSLTTWRGSRVLVSGLLGVRGLPSSLIPSSLRGGDSLHDDSEEPSTLNPASAARPGERSTQRRSLLSRQRDERFFINTHQHDEDPLKNTHAHSFLSAPSDKQGARRCWPDTRSWLTRESKPMADAMREALRRMAPRAPIVEPDSDHGATMNPARSCNAHRDRVNCVLEKITRCAWDPATGHCSLDLRRNTEETAPEDAGTLPSEGSGMLLGGGKVDLKYERGGRLWGAIRGHQGFVPCEARKSAKECHAKDSRRSRYPRSFACVWTHGVNKCRPKTCIDWGVSISSCNFGLDFSEAKRPDTASAARHESGNEKTNRTASRHRKTKMPRKCEWDYENALCATGEPVKSMKPCSAYTKEGECGRPLLRGEVGEPCENRAGAREDTRCWERTHPDPPPPLRGQKDKFQTPKNPNSRPSNPNGGPAVRTKLQLRDMNGLPHPMVQQPPDGRGTMAGAAGAAAPPRPAQQDQDLQVQPWLGIDPNTTVCGQLHRPTRDTCEGGEREGLCTFVPMHRPGEEESSMEHGVCYLRTCRAVRPELGRDQCNNFIFQRRSADGTSRADLEPRKWRRKMDLEPNWRVCLYTDKGQCVDAKEVAKFVDSCNDVPVDKCGLPHEPFSPQTGIRQWADDISGSSNHDPNLQHYLRHCVLDYDDKVGNTFCRPHRTEVLVWPQQEAVVLHLFGQDSEEDKKVSNATTSEEVEVKPSAPWLVSTARPPEASSAGGRAVEARQGALLTRARPEQPDPEIKGAVQQVQPRTAAPPARARRALLTAAAPPPRTDRPGVAGARSPSPRDERGPDAGNNDGEQQRGTTGFLHRLFERPLVFFTSLLHACRAAHRFRGIANDGHDALDPPAPSTSELQVDRELHPSFLEWKMPLQTDHQNLHPEKHGQDLDLESRAETKVQALIEKCRQHRLDSEACNKEPHCTFAPPKVDRSKVDRSVGEESKASASGRGSPIYLVIVLGAAGLAAVAGITAFCLCGGSKKGGSTVLSQEEERRLLAASSAATSAAEERRLLREITASASGDNSNSNNSQTEEQKNAQHAPSNVGAAAAAADGGETANGMESSAAPAAGSASPAGDADPPAGAAQAPPPAQAVTIEGERKKSTLTPFASAAGDEELLGSVAVESLNQAREELLGRSQAATTVSEVEDATSERVDLLGEPKVDREPSDEKKGNPRGTKTDGGGDGGTSNANTGGGAEAGGETAADIVVPPRSERENENENGGEGTLGPAPSSYKLKPSLEEEKVDSTA